MEKVELERNEEQEWRVMLCSQQQDQHEQAWCMVFLGDDSPEEKEHESGGVVGDLGREKV